MVDDLSRFIPKPPQQVSDQVAAVDAMINEANAARTGQPPQQQPGAVTVPAPTNPVAPSSQLAPPPAQPQPGAGTQPPGQPGVEDEATWERRFKSLQGRYDTMNSTYRQQGERLNNMEGMLALLQAGGQVPGNNAPQPVTPPERLVTDEEVTEYGEELLNVVGKRSKEVIAPELQAINLKLGELANRLDGTTQVLQKNTKAQFYDELTRAVPDWRVINKSQEFKDWVSFVDPFSGRTRHDMLKDAYAGQDTRRVVNFFAGFLTEATGTPPNGSSPGNGAPPLAQPGNGSGRPSLEQFAAPGRARSAPAGELPPDKPVYTTASVAKFYGDKLKGLYRGREADAAAIEADIFTAQREGRFHV